MSAKPIIDVLVKLNSFKTIDAAERSFKKLGYILRKNYVVPNSRLLEKFADKTKLYNIHLFTKNHAKARRMLNIKNYLLKNPKAVIAYEKLKKELYKKYWNNYPLYSKGKDKFIDSLAQKAEQWKKNKLN